MRKTDRAILADFALEMSDAYLRLAEACGAVLGTPPTYDRTTSTMPWQERILRQCMILNEIANHGGSVPQTTWYEIAKRFGYSGRGLAGFFRGDEQGLLDLRKGRVYITKRGKDRLSANIDRVQRALETEAEAEA